MPVDICEIARKCGGQYERQVVDRGAVSQLANAVIACKIGDDKSRREGDDHACPDAEDATDENQRRDVADKEAGDAAQQKNRQSDNQNTQFVPLDRKPSRKQDEGNDEQRGQRGEHLNFEIACRRKDRIQITQNRRNGQTGQRRDGRHGPDRQ